MPGLPDFQHGHSGNRAVGIFLSGGVHDVIGSDDHGDIGIGKLFVDLIHFHDDVVGNPGLSEQDIHVTGHTAGNRMNGEADSDSLRSQDFGDFKKDMLGLGDRHAVAGHDDD